MKYVGQPIIEPATFHDQESLKPILIQVPEPTIGNKVVLIKDRGIFVLETGPSSLRAMACTHAGSGGVVIYDGVPDEQGQFEGSDAKAPEHLDDSIYDDWIQDRWQQDEDKVEQYQRLLKAAKREYAIWYESRNGRPIYYAHPACMGMWMLDAGCRHGITVHNLGSDQSSSPIVTLTWMAFRTKKLSHLQRSHAVSQDINEAIAAIGESPYS
jgi:hypothetical protein